MSSHLKMELRVRDTGLGGLRTLEIERYPRANDDVTLTFKANADHMSTQSISVGIEDLPQVISCLRAFLPD